MTNDQKQCCGECKYAVPCDELHIVCEYPLPKYLTKWRGTFILADNDHWCPCFERKEGQQCCGDCRWYRPLGSQFPGACVAPIPKAMVRSNRFLMRPTDDLDCPCFERKEEPNP